MAIDIYIIDKILIPHAAFTDGINRLEQCKRYSKNLSDPIGISVTGPSRCGKTRLLEYFRSKYPAKRTSEGVICPVLYIEMPTSPTMLSLISTILRELGDPYWDEKKPERVLTPRLFKLLAECKVEVIIIDEGNHVSDKGSDKALYDVSNWIKLLMNRTKIMTVLSGLHTVNALLDQNEQLSARFTSGIKLNRFDWNDTQGRNEFRAILNAYHKGLDRYSMPDLSSHEMAYRFYHGTNGVIGFITKILRQSIWDAADRKSFEITLNDLSIAWRKSVRIDNNTIHTNPFEEEFMTSSQSDKLDLIENLHKSKEAPKAKQRRLRIEKKGE